MAAPPLCLYFTILSQIVNRHCRWRFHAQKKCITDYVLNHLCLISPNIAIYTATYIANFVAFGAHQWHFGCHQCHFSIPSMPFSIPSVLSSTISKLLISLSIIKQINRITNKISLNATCGYCFFILLIFGTVNRHLYRGLDHHFASTNHILLSS